MGGTTTTSGDKTLKRHRKTIKTRTANHSCEGCHKTKRGRFASILELKDYEDYPSETGSSRNTHNPNSFCLSLPLASQRGKNLLDLESKELCEPAVGL